MGRIKYLKAILFLFGFVPFLVTGQNYPRFELYQLKQGTDSGQFIVTGLDSNLAFNNILRFRSADSTFLIGTDTVAVKSDIASSLLLYVDRVELGDSLLLYVDRTELGDSLALYPNRIELGDTALAIRNTIPIQIGDSLINYVSRIELGDTSTNIRNSITTEIGDSLVNYPNRTELVDTASAIRLDIPTYISDSLSNYASRTELQDTASAIRADFPSGTGDVTTAQLADTALAIRADIPTLPIILGTQTNGNYIATGGTSGNGISGSATGEGSTFTITSNATTNNTANTIVFRNASGNFSAGTITAALSGNSSTATKLQTARTISLTSDVTGSASFDGSANASITATVVDDSHNHIISNVDFLSDSLSALRTAINAAGGGGLWSSGATPGEIYYNSGNVGIGNTDPNYPLHVTGRIYSSDDILVDDELIFGTNGTGVFPYIDNVAGKMLISNYLTTSSTLFDFYDKYNTVSPLLINTSTDTYQIEANGAVDIDGNLTQSGTIVQDGGTVTFNNSEANYDFGVYSDNCCTTAPFMWIDASADKVQIGSGNPQYTLDVTGDINFTNKLYQNGVEVTFGGGADTSYYTLNGSLDYTLNTEVSYIYIPSNYVGCTLVESTYGTNALNTNPFTGTIESDIGSASGNTFTSDISLFNDSYSNESNIIFVSNSHTYTINSSNRLIEIAKGQTLGLVTSIHFTFNIRCID